MRIPVELGERRYDVVVERDARHELAALVAQRAPRAKRAAVIVSADLIGQPWFDIRAGIDTVVITVPAGEQAKSFAVLESVAERLSAEGLSRDDVVIGVGGGATTDLAGFAAATYLRGVKVIHVATTLVAQVDAAIGGKTGVNISTGKNLVGAFHQPVGVLCDLSTLDTLPQRELRAGWGEVAKCWMLLGRDASSLESASLEERVAAAVALKAQIVAEDEREGGKRALLNYGHTLAHALEAETLAGRHLDLLHGEAVGIGTSFAARLAVALARVPASYVAETDDVLDVLGVRRDMPEGLSAHTLIAAMGRDKKAHHNLTFVLAGPSGFETVPDIEPRNVHDVLVQFGSKP